MATKLVTLEHPDLPDRPITVTEAAAKVHERSGWKKAKKAKATPAKKAANKATDESQEDES